MPALICPRCHARHEAPTECPCGFVGDMWPELEPMPMGVPAEDDGPVVVRGWTDYARGERR